MYQAKTLPEVCSFVFLGWLVGTGEPVPWLSRRLANSYRKYAATLKPSGRGHTIAFPHCVCVRKSPQYRLGLWTRATGSKHLSESRAKMNLHPTIQGQNQIAAELLVARDRLWRFCSLVVPDSDCERGDQHEYWLWWARKESNPQQNVLSTTCRARITGKTKNRGEDCRMLSWLGINKAGWAMARRLKVEFSSRRCSLCQYCESMDYSNNPTDN